MMPAHPKLPEDHWADVRARWESDPRNGYSWLVADLTIPVTGAAVRNRAIREGWCKTFEACPSISRPSQSCLLPCCRNNGELQKTTVLIDRIPRSVILERLALALAVLEDCARLLRETMPEKP